MSTPVAEKVVLPCTECPGKHVRAMAAPPLSEANNVMEVPPALDGFDLDTRLSLAYPDHITSDKKVIIKFVHFRDTESGMPRRSIKKKKKILGFIKSYVYELS